MKEQMKRGTLDETSGSGIGSTDRVDHLPLNIVM